MAKKTPQYVSVELSPQSIPKGAENAARLTGFKPWNYDCTFELSFPKRSLHKISVDPRHVLPFEVDVDGRVKPSGNEVRSIFDRAGTSASSLGEYGVFFFGAYFERKDKQQSAQFPSSVTLHHSPEGSHLDFTYRGSEEECVADIALEAQALITESGLAVEGSHDVSWWAVRCKLPSITPEAVRLLFHLMDRLGSGKVFEYFWSASILGVDTENVNKHAFELYDRAVESGLTADKLEVLFRLQFLDLQGLEVVRQLCEGDVRYTIPLGTFRHRKKNATLGVMTSAEGYRLTVGFKEEPTEEELLQIEAVLGQRFDRKPF